MTAEFILRPGTPDKEIARINKALKALKMIMDFQFIREKDNLEWLKSINEDPNSPQKHLKPEGRDLTLEELKMMFKSWTRVGVLQVDAMFGRCPPKDAVKILRFMSAEPMLLSIEGKSDLDRLKKEAIEVDPSLPAATLQALDALLEVPPPPEKNPDRREMPQSGVARFADWNGSDIEVLFGSVDSPRYMKDDEYLDDDYNPLYRDKEGRAYMLLPLLQFGPGIEKRLDEIYRHAYEIGLKTDPFSFYAAVYGQVPADAKSIVENGAHIGERDALFAILRLRGLQNQTYPTVGFGPSGKIRPLGRPHGESNGAGEAIAAFCQVLVDRHGHDGIRLEGVVNGDYRNKPVEAILGVIHSLDEKSAPASAPSM